MRPRSLFPLLLLAAAAGCAMRQPDIAAAGSAATPPATRGASSTNAADRAALVQSADALIAELPADTGAACIAIVPVARSARVPADGALLHALAPRARRVVASDRCPPTFAPVMFRMTDSLGKPVSQSARPAGYVDPYTLELMMPQRRADTLLVRARVWQGSGGSAYECRVAPADRVARCEWLFDFAS